MNVQFKKGILKLCVLSMLEDQDLYGYEIVDKISHTVEISEGTIYPLLKNLKTAGLVTTYLKESQEGPPRKYYKLSPEGEKEKDKLKSEWKHLSQNISKLLSLKP